MRIALAVVLLLAMPGTASARMPRAPHIEVIHAACPVDPDSSDACSYPDGRLYLDPGAPLDGLPFRRAHELGHLFDDEVMAPGDRIWFEKRIARGFGDWFRGITDERFADLYADCDLNLARDPDGTWAGGYGFDTMSDRRHFALCSAIVRVGARHI